jgi:hypothetical protein
MFTLETEPGSRTVKRRPFRSKLPGTGEGAALETAGKWKSLSQE